MHFDGCRAAGAPVKYECDLTNTFAKTENVLNGKINDHMGGVTNQSSVRKFLREQTFAILQKYLLYYFITFIFDKCHHSWAAVAPVKYERDIH